MNQPHNAATKDNRIQNRRALSSLSKLSSSSKPTTIFIDNDIIMMKSQHLAVEKISWFFQSLDNTISTVDSDGLSISSEECSLGETLIYETPQKTDTKRVSFACHPNGQVRCQVKEIDRIDDSSLWYSPLECHEIINECMEVVQYYKSRSQLCTVLTDFVLFRWIEDEEEVNEEHPYDRILDFLESSQDPTSPGRGLEQHIMGCGSNHIVRHRTAVFALQDQWNDTKRQDTFKAWKQISQAAALTSADCVSLAQQIALLDEQDACDAYEDLDEVSF